MQSLIPVDLGDILRDRALRKPDASLLERGASRWSNAQFHLICERLAQTLRAEAGDTAAVGVSAESSGLLPFLVWATVLADIDLWLLPALPTQAALSEYVCTLPVRVVYCDLPDLAPDDRLRPLSGVLEQLPAISEMNVESATSAVARRAAFVFQTSGTEGAPKTIRCEHWQFARVLSAMRTCGVLAHAEGARAYISQPLQHSYGLCSFLEYCSVDGTILLPPERSPLGPAGDLIQMGASVQAIEGVPYFWSQFAQLQKRLDLSELRHLGIGGGRLDAAVMQKVLIRYPQATVSVRYGLTETPSVATHKVYAPPHSDDWSSSGRIVPAYQVDIHDSNGQIVGAGMEGEIVISGDCVAAPAGVLRTGDLGYFDRRGELVVTGRRSAFIKRRGYRISPEVIESAAAGCEGVLDCRAVGRDDRLILEVVTDAELSVPQLIEQLRARIPAAMVPDEVQRVVSIERTYSGKIKRS